MANRRSSRANVKQLSTLAELKALSHPTRLRLFYALKAHGSLTATRLGEIVDESPASVSYHLRQLAANGFVEEAENETGDGRQRWWRASSEGFAWSASDFADSPSDAATADAAKAAMLEHEWVRLSEYGRTSTSWGPEWTEAAFSADYVLRLDPAQTEALSGELRAVVERFRSAGATSDSEDAATVMVLLHGFPTEM